VPARGLDALHRSADALARDVSPRFRVVALLLRSRVGAQQRLEAFEIGRSGGLLGDGGGRIRLGGLHLSLRLPHVLGA
jgi:hypothetical protein